MNAPFNPLQSWMQAGQQWACSQQLPRLSRQIFRSNGIYMPPPGLTFCNVKCLGGGGAGGRVTLAGGTNEGLGGGGGGSGSFSVALVPAALVAGGVAVTVGQGGVGNTSVGGAVIDGGDTSFGPLVLAHGGQSSDSVAPGNAQGSWFPGAGGAEGVGDYTPRGSDGTWGLVEYAAYNIVLGGRGADPPGDIGGGSWATTAAYNGQSSNITNVPGNGCGGTGAVANATVAAVNLQGQPGGHGVVIVDEYCFQPIQAGIANNPGLNVFLIPAGCQCGQNPCQCGTAQQSVAIPQSMARRLLEPSY